MGRCASNFPHGQQRSWVLASCSWIDPFLSLLENGTLSEIDSKAFRNQLDLEGEGNRKEEMSVPFSDPV